MILQTIHNSLVNLDAMTQIRVRDIDTESTFALQTGHTHQVVAEFEKANPALLYSGTQSTCTEYMSWLSEELLDGGADMIINSFVLPTIMVEKEELPENLFAELVPKTFTYTFDGKQYTVALDIEEVLDARFQEDVLWNKGVSKKDGMRQRFGVICHTRYMNRIRASVEFRDAVVAYAEKHQLDVTTLLRRAVYMPRTDYVV